MRQWPSAWQVTRRSPARRSRSYIRIRTGAAEAWIATHAAHFEAGTHVDLAVERPSDHALLGAIGLRIEREHARAELGYWIGVPYWGYGYCTEAARAIVRYGFTDLGLQRIYAYCFTTNPASGRVLQKLGMTHEGMRRKHTLKDGVFLSSDAYGILRVESDRFRDARDEGESEKA